MRAEMLRRSVAWSLLCSFLWAAGLRAEPMFTGLGRLSRLAVIPESDSDSLLLAGVLALLGLDHRRKTCVSIAKESP